MCLSSLLTVTFIPIPLSLSFMYLVSSLTISMSSRPRRYARSSYLILPMAVSVTLSLICSRFSSSSFHFPSRARVENTIRKNFMFSCLIYVWDACRVSLCVFLFSEGTQSGGLVRTRPQNYLNKSGIPCCFHG